MMQASAKCRNRVGGEIQARPGALSCFQPSLPLSIIVKADDIASIGAKSLFGEWFNRHQSG